MKKLSEEILYEGEWLCLKKSYYENQLGDKVSWEHLDRTKSRHAVVMLATLKPSNRIVLIRQFRVGVDGNVIGLPAGLCESEDIADNALRELKEETGYIGKVTNTSPELCSFPALSSSTMQLVQIEVDESLPENQNPRQELEPNEQIEVILVEKPNVRTFLLEQQKSGHHLVSGLWFLFGGLAEELA